MTTISLRNPDCNLCRKLSKKRESFWISGAYFVVGENCTKKIIYIYNDSSRYICEKDSVLRVISSITNQIGNESYLRFLFALRPTSLPLMPLLTDSFAVTMCKF